MDSINYTNPAVNPFLDISKQAVGGEQYISAMTNEWYIYGSSGHGRFARAIPVAGDGGYDNLFYDSPEIQSRYLKHKQYELKDHLGNVRVVVSDFKKNNNPANSDPPYYAEVLAAYNYYPFGMLQPGMYKENDNLRYRFGFNGMLRDDDMTDKLSTGPDEGRGNSYDFGARMYNPRVTRFFGLDPMKLSFPWQSPYVFAGNDPVAYIDAEGKGPKDRVKYARSFTNSNNWISYKQETAINKRTKWDKESLRQVDCSELVGRVLFLDKIDSETKKYTTYSLKEMLKDESKWIKSDVPQIGDVVLWRNANEGHTAIVSEVDPEKGTYKLIHAVNTKLGLKDEDKPRRWGTGSSKPFIGYFRPVNETPDILKSDFDDPLTAYEFRTRKEIHKIEMSPIEPMEIDLRSDNKSSQTLAPIEANK